MATYSKKGKLIGRPPGSGMSAEQRKAKHPNSCGTKEKVVADLTRYVENPDEPMVPHSIARALETTRNMDVSPTQMFADGGHKVNAIRYIAARSTLVSPPKTESEVFAFLEEYFTWSGENRVPITLGAFSLWCGVTQQMIGKIERDTRDPERARAYARAKECIRTFLETAAYEGTLNPILWFHTNKVSFGAVENQQVTITVDDNKRELEDAELDARIIQLTQGPDGVYRE